MLPVDSLCVTEAERGLSDAALPPRQRAYEASAPSLTPTCHHWKKTARRECMGDPPSCGSSLMPPSASIFTPPPLQCQDVPLAPSNKKTLAWAQCQLVQQIWVLRTFPRGLRWCELHPTELIIVWSSAARLPQSTGHCQESAVDSTGKTVDLVARPRCLVIAMGHGSKNACAA